MKILLLTLSLCMGDGSCQQVKVVTDNCYIELMRQATVAAMAHGYTKDAECVAGYSI